MSLNIPKCHSMSFYRIINPIKCIHTIHNNPFNSLLSVKDLDIIFSHNLCFREYIKFIVKKSAKLLGFIKHRSTKFNDPRSFKALYLALVKSILEFGSII